MKVDGTATDAPIQEIWDQKIIVEGVEENGH